MAQMKVMGFAEPVIEPATSGRTRWLNPSYGLRYLIEIDVIRSDGERLQDLVRDRIWV
jgi:hypothetical protein